MSFFAPDAVLDGRMERLEGRAAIRRFLDDWFGSFAELRMEPEEFVVLNDAVVLAVVNQEGRLVGVDRQVHQREGWVICWSADGLLVRLRALPDIDEARAAAERLAESRGEARRVSPIDSFGPPSHHHPSFFGRGATAAFVRKQQSSCPRLVLYAAGTLPAVRATRERIAAAVEGAQLLAAAPDEDRAIWATAMYA